MLCNHAFGLDEAFAHSTAALKRNLLTLLHRKEFSTEVTQGIEPSLILVVPDVICEACQNSADLDICRELQEGQESEDGGADWKCKQCEAALNRVNIERRLIDLLNRRMLTYQLQDLSCKRCKMVSNSLIPATCQCTGTFEQTAGFQAPDKLKNPNLLN